MGKFLAVLAVGLALTIGAYAQSGQRQVPMGFCYDTSLGSAVALTAFTCASFTGTGSGTRLTATSVNGQIQVGQTVSGTGVPAGTTIVSQVSGTANGAGVYVTSQATTSSGASLTTGGAPQNATYAVICAYTEAVNYRDDGTAPTATTASGGQTIPAAQCIPYNGTFTALQFIQQAGGGEIGISFYK